MSAWISTVLGGPFLPPYRNVFLRLISLIEAGTIRERGAEMVMVSTHC